MFYIKISIIAFLFINPYARQLAGTYFSLSVPVTPVSTSVAGAVEEWHSQLIEPEVGGVPEVGVVLPTIGINFMVGELVAILFV